MADKLTENHDSLKLFVNDTTIDIEMRKIMSDMMARDSIMAKIIRAETNQNYSIDLKDKLFNEIHENQLRQESNRLKEAFEEIENEIKVMDSILNQLNGAKNDHIQKEIETD